MKNNSICKLVRSLLLAASLFLGVQSSHAVRYDFGIDTTALQADPGAVYGIEFLLTGGGPNDTTVSVLNFSFGGGHATSAPDVFGDVTLPPGSDLTAGTLTLSTPSGFLSNYFYQEFVVGSMLVFNLELTPGFNTPNPDAFLFSIYKDGDNISGPGGSLFRFDFISPSPTLQIANAGGVTVSIPDNGPTLGLLGFAFLGMCATQSPRVRRIFANA